jgi:hypothetical protein
MRRAGLLLVALAAASGTIGAGGTVPQSSTVRQSEASAEAQRLLGGLAFPAGAGRSASEPAGDAGHLAAPRQIEAFPELAEAGAWWVVPGTAPPAVLGYLRERSPELAAVGGWYPLIGEAGVAFAQARLGDGAGVIGERWLRFRALTLPDGSTGLRVDVQVLWLLPRDPIPAGSRILKIEARRVRVGHPKSRVYLIRSARLIAKVVRLLNSLPAERPSLVVRSCPADFGSIRLSFYRKATEPAVAVVTMGIGGCGGVGVEIRGKPPQPGLESNELLGQVERILRRKIEIA